MTILLFDGMADRMHQVSLAKANSAVEKQRIVSFARRLGCTFRSGVCKLIARTYDKFFECVFWVQRTLDRFDVHEICSGRTCHDRWCRRRRLDRLEKEIDITADLKRIVSDV